ncbi:hypothetical protein GQX59_08580 [Brachyspira hyodysenteriae]|uniref:hypothetical protein n=1 Tax=Brachyspira hyodysenteriae TaxID=159 RepID=UPI001ADD8020|nr:hypothetical protein [Brachyspira hyodysenteriae]QTM11481.1 hypothetical protein GQX59_08580 [Brachyspira hyodysenteriae]
MNDNKIIHIKKLGIAFYKDDFKRALVGNGGVYIHYKNGRYDFVKCKSQRQANLWVTLIVKKLNGEVK